MIGTHQSKAEPWMLRNAMTDVDRMGLLFRFKSVEKSLTSISRAMDDHLPTFSRYKTHTASRPCVLTAIFRRSISSCEVFGARDWGFRKRRDIASRPAISWWVFIRTFANQSAIQTLQWWIQRCSRLVHNNLWRSLPICPQDEFGRCIRYFVWESLESVRLAWQV